MSRVRRNLVGPVHMAGRNLRVGWAAPLVFFALALLTAFGTAATPRFINAASDDALRTATREALPVNRNILFQRSLQIPSGPQADDPLATVRDAGVDLRDQLPEAVSEVIVDTRYVADSALFEVWSLPDDGAPFAYRLFRFRVQDGAEDHIEFVEGGMPQASAEPVTIEEDGAQVEVPAYQTAISLETSNLLRIGVGDRVILIPRVGDDLHLGVPQAQLRYRLVLEISGVFTIPDPHADFWYADRRLHEPVVLENPAAPDTFLFTGMGLLGPGDYERLLADMRPSRFNYGWRFFVDPDRLDAAGIDQLTGELRELAFQYPRRGPPGSVWMLTGLERIGDVFRAQQYVAVSMLSLISIGLIALVSAVALLLAALRARRLADLTGLIRSRGASVGQLSWTHFIEGLVLFLPAALLGYGLALVLIDGRNAALSLPATLAVGFVFAVVGVALALPTFARSRETHREGALNGRTSGRRLVVEAVVVIGAIVGLVLLRRRGLLTDRSVDLEVSIDLLLAAVPVLLGLSFGLVILRLYPLLVALVASSPSGRRGIVGFVGLRRVARQPAPARLPILVMLLAVGVAVFGSVLTHTIAEGQQDSASQQVGADYRIESVRDGAPVSRLVDLSALETIEATADATEFQARLPGTDYARGAFAVVALDPEEYGAVVGGTRADPEFPAVMMEQPEEGVGSPSNPVPALVSQSWLGERPLDIGDTVTLNIGREDVTIRAYEIRQSFPGLEMGQPFVVIARASLEAAGPTLDLRATRRYVRAPEEAGPQLLQTVRAQSLDSRLVSRPELLAGLTEAPFVKAVETANRIAVVIAALLAGLAAVAAIALTADERSRDLGYLRTIGLAPRQVVSLTVVEQLPPAVLATGTGVLLGVTLAWLTHPGLDLSQFAGMAADLRIDWGSAFTIAIALLVSVLAAIATYSYLTRRLNLGDVLRLGDRL